MLCCDRPCNAVLVFSTLWQVKASFECTLTLKKRCRAVDVAAGWYTSYVSDETGRVFAFGLDNYGQASAGPARDDADSDEVMLLVNANQIWADMTPKCEWSGMVFIAAVFLNCKVRHLLPLQLSVPAGRQNRPQDSLDHFLVESIHVVRQQNLCFT